MRAFHVAVHARDADVECCQRQSIELTGCSLTALALDAATSAGLPLPYSFETTAERLEALEGLFFEPDGSFIWSSRQGSESSWQLEGNLFDRNGRLLYVDLKGCSSRQPIEQLLTAIAGAERVLLFQLMQQGVFLDEQEFLRYVAEK